MTKFSLPKLHQIDEFQKSNGWCKAPFPMVENLYNSIFELNLHSKCPVCAHSRYTDALRSWFKLGLKWIAKNGLVFDSPYGLPLGLSTKTMNSAQRQQYDSLPKDMKSAYNKASKSTKVAYDEIEDVIE